MKTIIVILGTRPEAIKLAPVILTLRDKYNVLVCNTEQQKELSNQTLKFFEIKANFNLNVMTPNQTLAGVQSRILISLSNIYSNNHIDATIIQGDTMTAFCGALVSFYNKVPIFHIEAGLRSNNLFEPFPEEAIRQMISRVADLHFAPTQLAYKVLLREGINKSKVILTGNTVIDALFCLPKRKLYKAKIFLEKKNIKFNGKLVLITVHRRENHGDRLDNILFAIDQLAKSYPDHQFILPLHPNPNVHDKVYRTLKYLPNIILFPPLNYPELVCLMRGTKLIMTDSGGIQEEGPTFGNPILVMRYETERVEGIKAGFGKLVGANIERIIAEANLILSKKKLLTRKNGKKNPYGDGKSAQKIKKAIDAYFKNIR